MGRGRDWPGALLGLCDVGVVRVNRTGVRLWPQAWAQFAPRSLCREALLSVRANPVGASWWLLVGAPAFGRRWPTSSMLGGEALA